MNPLDRLYLERACELAERGIGNTSPNPAVGAVVVRDCEVVGEGYHHRAGEAHAEVNALRAAGDRAQDATLYVTLEPCNHHGRTPPCSKAVVNAGIARVVVGAPDPNPKTGGAGILFLRDSGIYVDVVNDPRSLANIEPFARAIRARRPFVSLKMAMSMDGFVASRPGRQEWLTGTDGQEFVRELRVMHDAVAVGAGTVRIDNPQLTVRPPHHRLRDYVRVVLCESDSVDPSSAVFAPHPGYATTIVLAPTGAAARFEPLQNVANVIFIGNENDMQLDLDAALYALRGRDIMSLLCEGGPTFAGHLLGEGLVDRFHWLIAPRLLRSENAVPVITAGSLGGLRGLRFDRVERLGRDLLVSGIIEPDV